MTPKRFMLIAGEASGDMLAAELVGELRAAIARESTYSQNVQPLQSDLAPVFFGAGGPRMAEAGVELTVDMTQHSVIGVPSVQDYLKFSGFLDELFELAKEREPHVVVCVDFSTFNRKFAAITKKYVRERRGTFNNWNPKIIQYISPQVWASREGRARQIARDYDLLLSIFPFEPKWYAARVPKLPVKFVGHPLIERHANAKYPARSAELAASPSVLLLPGSRRNELERHWPVMLAAWQRIQTAMSASHAKVVLPSEEMAALARSSASRDMKIQVGGLADALAEADLAIASTGTVTMECAFFGVPTVTMYKTSWMTYQVGKRLIKVKSLTMPNLLAEEDVYPEFIQDAATPENISRAALELLQNRSRREKVRSKLAEVIASLGGPGASRRAAEAILSTIR